MTWLIGRLLHRGLLGRLLLHRALGHHGCLRVGAAGCRVDVAVVCPAVRDRTQGLEPLGLGEVPGLAGETGKTSPEDALSRGCGRGGGPIVGNLNL